jgi:hypothetical protein
MSAVFSSLLKSDWTGPGNNQDRIIMATPESDAKTTPAAAAYVVRDEPAVKMKAPGQAGDYVLQYRTLKLSPFTFVLPCIRSTNASSPRNICWFNPCQVSCPTPSNTKTR